MMTGRSSGKTTHQARIIALLHAAGITVNVIEPGGSTSVPTKEEIGRKGVIIDESFRMRTTLMSVNIDLCSKPKRPYNDWRGEAGNSNKRKAPRRK